MKTGAWARYTGWDARAVVAFGDAGYFADATRYVFRMEDGGSDDGAAYTCRYLGLPEAMGTGAAFKSIGLMRYMLTSSVDLNPSLAVAVDYDETGAPDPVTGADGVLPRWNVTYWDTAYWDGGDPVLKVSNWASGGKSGFSIAPELKLTFDITVTPKVELLAIDVTFAGGAVVT
jgi:hypothetical protein